MQWLEYFFFDGEQKYKFYNLVYKMHHIFHVRHENCAEYIWEIRECWWYIRPQVFIISYTHHNGIVGGIRNGLSADGWMVNWLTLVSYIQIHVNVALTMRCSNADIEGFHNQIFSAESTGDVLEERQTLGLTHWSRLLHICLSKICHYWFG